MTRLHERIVAAAGWLAALTLVAEFGVGARAGPVLHHALTFVFVAVFALSTAPAAGARGGVVGVWRAGWPSLVLAAALVLRSLAGAHYEIDDPATTHRLLELLRLSVVARVGLAVIVLTRVWRACEHAILAGMLARPVLSLLCAYAILIATATILLRLPFATFHDPLRWVDAGFMAVSAATLTGFSVVGIADTLTRGGQIALIAIVQLSAIVIMSFGAAFWLVLRREVGATTAPPADQPGEIARLRRMLRIVVVATIGIELLGTALLFFRLPVAEFSVYTRVFMAGFHAASAFCNAGFSVYSRGMAPFYADWDISMSIAGLALAGGLGVLVWAAVADTAHRRGADGQALRAQARMVLFGSLALTAIGAAIFALAGRSVLEALFQSVNTRSAGFHTASSDELVVTALLMFVGGAPGSAAGGVKITTVVVLLAAPFARSIRRGAAFLAAAMVVAFSVFAIGAGIVLLSVAEATPLRALVLEAVSAFGTVGLSFGQTTSLTTPSRFIIMAMMLLGRVAPMIIGLVIHRRFSRPPDGTLMIG